MMSATVYRACFFLLPLFLGVWSSAARASGMQSVSVNRMQAPRCQGGQYIDREHDCCVVPERITSDSKRRILKILCPNMFLRVKPKSFPTSQSVAIIKRHGELATVTEINFHAFCHAELSPEIADFTGLRNIIFAQECTSTAPCFNLPNELRRRVTVTGRSLCELTFTAPAPRMQNDDASSKVRETPYNNNKPRPSSWSQMNEPESREEAVDTESSYEYNANTGYSTHSRSSHNPQRYEEPRDTDASRPSVAYQSSSNSIGYCLNGGKTVCSCAIGYTGDRCESKVAVNWCNSTSVYEQGRVIPVKLCEPHGRCVFDLMTGSHCECAPGWSGTFCDNPIPGQVVISTRCHFNIARRAQATSECAPGFRCLPERLDCGFGLCAEPDNIGWCIPFPAFTNIMSSYDVVQRRFR